MFNNFFFENLAILWDNVEKCSRARQATDENIIRRTPIACWITKATDTRSEYAIVIASPQQQWLRERPSMLRLHYIVCLVDVKFDFKTFQVQRPLAIFRLIDYYRKLIILSFLELLFNTCVLEYRHLLSISAILPYNISNGCLLLV
jgi:hypothetical protein